MALFQNLKNLKNLFFLLFLYDKKKNKKKILFSVFNISLGTLQFNIKILFIKKYIFFDMKEYASKTIKFDEILIEIKKLFTKHVTAL